MLTEILKLWVVIYKYVDIRSYNILYYYLREEKIYYFGRINNSLGFIKNMVKSDA
jgi:hypothetical protein